MAAAHRTLKQTLIGTDMEHLLQTSELKIPGHISVVLLPVGYLTF